MARLFALLVVPLIAALQYGGSAAAQDWPTRPITMIVAFPAGGSDDILGRIVASRLSEILGQQVIVENTSGGGGTTGTGRVARAAPDGPSIRAGHLRDPCSEPGAAPQPRLQCRDRFRAGWLDCRTTVYPDRAQRFAR